MDDHRQPHQHPQPTPSFPFGVAMLPAKQAPRHARPAAATSTSSRRRRRPQQEAAFKFIKWMTAPRARRAVEHRHRLRRRAPAAWDTPAMKKYAQEFPPALVARDQLQYSVAELSTHDNQRVTKALNDGLQAALTGTKPPAAGDEGRAARGRRASCKDFKQVTRRRPRRADEQPRHATRTRARASTPGCCCCRRWRCSSRSPTGRRSRPSVDSFYSTPRQRPAGALRRPRQLPRRWSRTRCSGRRSANNLWFAVGTIPLSIALALADGAVGQRAASPGRALPAHGLLHADGAADDRGRQHLAVLLHAAIRPARADHAARSACRSHNWLGDQRHGARRDHRRRDLEGGRLLHDLLPRGAAADPARASPRPRRSKARRAGTSSAACSFRC